MAEDNAHFESLDYLIPPVKKSHGTPATDLLFSRDLQRQTGIRLIKDFRKKIRRRSSPTEIHVHVPDVQTSTSVILKKTTEELVHEHYSYVNSSNNNCKTTKYWPVNEEPKKKCIEDNPMIKVTLIPREAVSQTKVFNRRRSRTKELQSTVSNQENSIKSQNIYFMVKGKRREKVYEIKSSESTNLSNKYFNAKYEDISIQQITNSKRLINSLNMEKKKRKNKKTIQNNQKIKNIDGTCQDVKNYVDSKGVNSRKSKVTIVGQLGLNRDDQYILKCAATVNDKPIATNYVKLDNTCTNNNDHLNINRYAEAFNSKFKSTAFSIDDGDNYRKFRSKQDSNDQTDMCYANKCSILDSNIKEHRMTSQATQVNFNQLKKIPSKAIKNKNAQCNCDILTEYNVFNIGPHDNVLNNDKSPVVIISVYPRHDIEDKVNSHVKTIQQPSSSQKKVSNINYNTFKGGKRQQKNDCMPSINKSEQRSLRSRSPSPVTKTLPKKNLNDKTVYRVLGKNNRNINTSSPQPQINVNKSRHKLNNMKKDASCNCPYSDGLESYEHSRLEVRPKVCDIKENDTKQVKRALVNHFLKSVDRIVLNDAKTKLLTPKNDTSRVTINIDGEKECLDLLLEQNDFDTGLSVRKSMKKPLQTLNNEGEVSINSMEQFLLLSDEMQKGKSKYLRETPDISQVEPIESRLNVRDSLEISHSREGRAVSRLNVTQIKGKDDLTNSFDSDPMAPVKHYRGDDCSILDPNERDREIRALLGIVRNTRNLKRDEFVATKDRKASYCHPENQKTKKSCSCCIKRSSKSLMTKISISKLEKKCSKIKNDKNHRISRATTQSNKCEVKQMEKTGTRSSQQNKNLTDTRVLFDELLTNEVDEPERCITNKQEYENFTNEDGHEKYVEVPNKKYYIEQNLVLNRNVKVFLQIERLTTEKPLILNRKQYRKVKRTIQCTMKQHKYCNYNNLNIVSVSEIKVKPRQQRLRYDREVQTERSEIQRTVRCKQIQTLHNKIEKRKIQNTKQNKSGERNVDDTNFTAETTNDKNINQDVIKTPANPNDVTTRQTVSSIEICYTNAAYMTHNTFSATQYGDGLHNKTADVPNPSTSIHTIFKGHRKSATPNLGTSAYSLCSDTNNSIKSIKAIADAGDSKPKKPFLQRLLSCLVMRSTETTVLKDMPAQILHSVNSSVDSYHINTSLGGLGMASSLYDTSASFYSNHKIEPVNKMKRGFLSSVRGFLSTRRS